MNNRSSHKLSLSRVTRYGGGGRGTDAAGGFGGGCDGSFPKVELNRFVVTTTVYALITWAYGYNKVSFVSLGDLLTGGPGWIRSERFEIQALMPDGSPTYTFEEFMKGDAPRLEKMLQTLLADRFKLVLHRETKEVPGYALIPGRGGPKLTRSKDEDKPGLGMRRHADQNGQMSNTIVGRKAERRDFAFLLLMTTRRPVIDRTGLTGEFNFDVEFAPFDSDAPADSTAPSLFTALQEHSGFAWRPRTLRLMAWSSIMPRGLRRIDMERWRRPQFEGQTNARLYCISTIKPSRLRAMWRSAKWKSARNIFSTSAFVFFCTSIS